MSLLQRQPTSYDKTVNIQPTICDESVNTQQVLDTVSTLSTPEPDTSAVEISPLSDKKLIFICGLHRSGTTFLQHMLGTSPHISMHTLTSVPENEGQHIQHVYKPALAYGGVGAFANHPEYHYTNTSPLLTKENNEKLLSEWGRYWDLTKPILLEKSPPNLIHTRYLQELVAQPYFIVIIRHPLVVAKASLKMNRQPIELHIKHWITAHAIFYSDKRFLRHCKVIHYHELACPSMITDIATFLHEDASALCISTDTFENTDLKYLEQDTKNIDELQKYESEINAYGYSFFPPYYITPTRA